MTPTRRLSRWTPCLGALLLCSVPALGYAPSVHQVFPERALVGDARLKTDTLPPVTVEDLAAFRAFLDAQFRQHPDEAVKADYIKRVSRPTDLDAQVLKRLMGLNAGRQAQGFDHAKGVGGLAMSVIAAGIAQPEVDGRNQDRVVPGHGGSPQKLPDGRVIPVDPLILNLGDALGPSSAHHAHFALVDSLSTDMQVLKSDPRRFALPLGWPDGPVKGMARDYAQLHYDLAVLAVLSNTAAGNTLGHLLLAHSLHYLSNLGNQVQTVQVGLDDFFFQARMATWGVAFKTLGGFVGDLRPTVDVAMELVASHRALADALLQKRIMELVDGKRVPESVQAAVAGLSQDDKQFKPELDMAVAQAITRTDKTRRFPAALVIADKLVDASSREAPEVFRHVAGAVQPRMASYDYRYDGKGNPDDLLGDVSRPEVKAHVDSLYWTQAKGLSHAGTCMRLLLARFRADTTVADDQERATRVALFASSLLRERLVQVRGQEERMAAFIAKPPALRPATVKEPAWLVLTVVTPLLVVGAGVLVVRRSRRARKDEAAQATA